MRTFGQMVADLARANVETWNLCDEAQSTDDHRSLAAHRAIHPANLRRSALIREIDEYVLSIAPPLPEDGPPRRETVGSLVDALTINTLKREKWLTLQADTSTADPRNEGKLDALIVQQGDIIRELDARLEGVLTGRERMKVYEQAKRYGGQA